MRLFVLRTGSPGTGGAAPNGVYVSDDDGATWGYLAGTTSPNNDDTRILACGFVAYPNVWLAVGTDRVNFPTAMVVWASIDNGLTWARRATLFSSPYALNAENFCYFDADYQFVATNNASTSLSFLVRSTDKFLTFSLVALVVPGDPINQLRDVHGMIRLIGQDDFEVCGPAVGGNAVLDSADGGLTFVYLNAPGNIPGITGVSNFVISDANTGWIAVQKPFPGNAPLYDAPSGPYVDSGYGMAAIGSFVAGSRAPYRTGYHGKKHIFMATEVMYTDDGETWTDLGGGAGVYPPQDSGGATTLAWVLPDTGTFLYTGSIGQALPRRSTDHGKTWANTTSPSGDMSFGRLAGISAGPPPVIRAFGGVQEARAGIRASKSGKTEILARVIEKSTIPARAGGGPLDEVGRRIAGVSETGRILLGGIDETGRRIVGVGPFRAAGDMQQEALIGRRPAPLQAQEARGGIRRAPVAFHEAVRHLGQARTGAFEALGTRARQAIASFQEARARRATARAAAHEVLSGRRVPLSQPVHTQEALGRLRRARAGAHEGGRGLKVARAAFQEARSSLVRSARTGYQEALRGAVNVLHAVSSFQEARKALAVLRLGAHEARAGLRHVTGSYSEAMGGVRRAIAGYMEVKGGVRRALSGWQEVLMSNARRARSGAQEARRRLSPARVGMQEVLRGLRGPWAGAHEALLRRKSTPAGAHEAKGWVSHATAGFQEARGKIAGALWHGAHEAKGWVSRAIVSRQEALGRPGPARGAFQEAKGRAVRAMGAFHEVRGAALMHAISGFQEARARIARGRTGAHEAYRLLRVGRAGVQEARGRIRHAMAGAQEAGRRGVARAVAGAQEALIRARAARAGFHEQTVHFIASFRRGGQEALAQSHTFQRRTGAQEAKGILKPRRTGWIEALFAPFIPTVGLPPEVHEVDRRGHGTPKAGPRGDIDAHGRPPLAAPARPGIFARLRRIMPGRRDA